MFCLVRATILLPLLSITLLACTTERENSSAVTVVPEGSGGSGQAGAGGSDAGAGGSDAGSGGSDAGSGGTAGSGGSPAGSGGSSAGSGGSAAGSGGSTAGSSAAGSGDTAAPAPAEDDGGCSMRGPGREGSGAAMLLVLGLLASRRRR